MEAWSIEVNEKKRGRGRPRTGIGKVIGVRLYADMEAEIDAWIAAQPDPKPSKPAAIRRLVGDGLRMKKKHAG